MPKSIRETTDLFASNTAEEFLPVIGFRGKEVELRIDRMLGRSREPRRSNLWRAVKYKPHLHQNPSKIKHVLPEPDVFQRILVKKILTMQPLHRKGLTSTDIQVSKVVRHGLPALCHEMAGQDCGVRATVQICEQRVSEENGYDCAFQECLVVAPKYRIEWSHRSTS